MFFSKFVVNKNIIQIYLTEKIIIQTTNRLYNVVNLSNH